ncbi:unnamed protein product, partial [Onchocerca ochengi]
KQPPISSSAYKSFLNQFPIKTQKGADLNPCELSPDQGTSITGILSSYRWYFDIAADRCIRFNYFGSAGNANNFETDRLCFDVCGI